MPRVADVVEDRSALDGSRVDVAARIGWLLRTSRTVGGVSLRTMVDELRARGLRTSVTALSRLETEGQRSGAVIDGYERVLNLPTGRLRAPVDVLCRTFDHAPPDQEPFAGAPDLTVFSAAVAAVADSPTGGDWLRFAEEHSGVRGFGVTAEQMEEAVGRLASELGRSVGVAYLSRYEALARLRCSPYADVVEDVVRRIALAQDTQILYDLMSAVSEGASARLLAWTSELLDHERRIVMVGATLAIENIRTVGDLDGATWLEVVPHFLRAYSAADRSRRVVLTRLFKNLPPRTRAAITAGLTDRLEPVPGPVDWSRSRRNVHYELCRRLAARACADLGQPDQPMLAPLLFEVLYDFRNTRSATSAFLLVASPYAHALHRPLMETVLRPPDETTRDAALGALTWFPGEGVPDVAAWLTGPDPDLAGTARVLLAHEGVPLPDAVLEAGLSEGEDEVRLLLYCAGMARHPRLRELSEDPARSPAVRAAAAWWLREGGRITDRR